MAYNRKNYFNEFSYEPNGRVTTGKMLASKVWEKPYFQRAWLIIAMS